MQEPMFWGLTAVDWAAIGTVVAAIGSLVNAVVVVALAMFTFKYMRSTKELVEIGSGQKDASIRKADAAMRSVELLILERRETDSFQHAVFKHAVGGIASDLGRYVSVILAPVAPWREADCWLIPSEWDTCRSFVSRKAPHLLEEMQMLEHELNDASASVQGIIRAPTSQWLPTAQKRKALSEQLTLLRKRIEAFGGQALGSAAQIQ